MKIFQLIKEYKRYPEQSFSFEFLQQFPDLLKEFNINEETLIEKWRKNIYTDFDLELANYVYYIFWRPEAHLQFGRYKMYLERIFSGKIRKCRYYSNGKLRLYDSLVFMLYDILNDDNDFIFSIMIGNGFLYYLEKKHLEYLITYGFEIMEASKIPKKFELSYFELVTTNIINQIINFDDLFHEPVKLLSRNLCKNIENLALKKFKKLEKKGHLLFYCINEFLIDIQNLNKTKIKNIHYYNNFSFVENALEFIKYSDIFENYTKMFLVFAKDFGFINFNMLDKLIEQISIIFHSYKNEKSTLKLKTLINKIITLEIKKYQSLEKFSNLFCNNKIVQYGISF